MIQTIYLHSAAHERFGGPYRLDVRDAAETVRALCCMKPGFREFMMETEWCIHRGPLERGYDIDGDRDSLNLAIGRAGELHFIPMVAGSASGKGIGKILVGVALVAASFFTAGTSLAALGPVLFGGGLGIATAGVSAVVAKTPTVKDYGDREQNKPNKLFNGAIQLTEPGTPYPLALGRVVRTGSVIGQASLTTEQF